MAKYLYNGVPMSKLPKWDKTACLYAVIAHLAAGNYILCITEHPWVGTGEEVIRNSESYGEGMNASVWRFRYNSVYDGTDWEFDSENMTSAIVFGKMKDSNSDGIIEGISCVLWSNHDIISSDGSTVLVSASYPIDAETGEEIRDYEPITLEKPKRNKRMSFMIGWLLNIVGNRNSSPTTNEETDAYTFDASEKMLTIKQDDGSLDFSFDWNKMQMDVEAKR